jgi:hypothetical protein
MPASEHHHFAFCNLHLKCSPENLWTPCLATNIVFLVTSYIASNMRPITSWDSMLRRLLAIFPLGFLLLAGCGLPCIGSRVQTPDRHIVVVDTVGQPLTNYDLYVYRCTNPGSKAGRVFYFPARKESDFYLPRKSETAIKRLGGVWLSPHVYESYEPQPYWVAAVNKPGYKSRRWSLDETQGDPVKIVLERSAAPGEDYCDGTISDCNPCRFHEYFMYQVMRYCHSDCHPESNPEGAANRSQPLRSETNLPSAAAGSRH